MFGKGTQSIEAELHKVKKELAALKPKHAALAAEVATLTGKLGVATSSVKAGQAALAKLKTDLTESEASAKTTDVETIEVREL